MIRDMKIIDILSERAKNKSKAMWIVIKNKVRVGVKSEITNPPIRLKIKNVTVGNFISRD